MNPDETGKGFHQPPNELLGMVDPPAYPTWFVFRRFLVHAGVAAVFFLFYDAHSTGCFHGSKKVWRAYHDKEDSYDSYIRGIEEGYL